MNKDFLLHLSEIGLDIKALFKELDVDRNTLDLIQPQHEEEIEERLMANESLHKITESMKAFINEYNGMKDGVKQR